MIDVEYLHVCDYAFQAQGGKACIIGIFETIAAAEFPFVHNLMAVALQLRGQQHEQAELRIEISGPNGDVVVAINAQVSMSQDGGNFIECVLSRVKFPEPGRYDITVVSKGQTLASKSILLLKGLPAGGSQLAPKTH